MSDQTRYKLLEWSEWAAKLMLVAVLGLVWRNNEDMQTLKGQIASQQSAQQSINTEVKAELSAIKQGYMTRMEVLETVKRVEQNQEIIMLKFKLDKHKAGDL